MCDIFILLTLLRLLLLLRSEKSERKFGFDPTLTAQSVQPSLLEMQIPKITYFQKYLLTNKHMNGTKKCIIKEDILVFISVHSNLLDDRGKMLVHYKGRGRQSSWLSLRSGSQILRRAWQTLVTAYCSCGVPNMSLYLTVFHMEYISVGSWDVILWHFIKCFCESIVPVPQILQLTSSF